MRVFIVGAGYSGRAFGRRLEGRAEFVGGTTRSREKAGRLAESGIDPFIFDGEIDETLRAALETTTHLVVSAGPGDDGDPFLHAARQTIMAGMPALEWIGYLSTVGVYGDHAGAWVDEETECRPVSRRSIARLKAEAEWLELAQDIAAPLAILRLSGIYGPGRNALLNLDAGRARRIVKPGQIFNRIHVDDIAGALLRLAGHRAAGIFNVTDDEPSPPQDVVAYAAELMNVAAPPEIAFEDANLSPMARSFYGERKRVSNARIRATGFDFAYPDYRTGLKSLWRSGNWRGDTC